MSESEAVKQEANTPRCIILGPGEGRTIGGITLKATSEQTGGSIGFLEATTPPRAGSPRHVHYGCDELFYVLEGQFLFVVGERQVSGPPGTFVFIPRGMVHAAKAIGIEPGKVLAAYIHTKGPRAILRGVRSVAGPRCGREIRLRVRRTTSIAHPCRRGRRRPAPHNVAEPSFREHLF